MVSENRRYYQKMSTIQQLTKAAFLPCKGNPHIAACNKKHGRFLPALIAFKGGSSLDLLTEDQWPTKHSGVRKTGLIKKNSFYQMSHLFHTCYNAWV